MRRAAATAGVAAVLVTCAACSNPNLTRRELVVVFAPTAPHSQHVDALRACSDVTPKASPEPLPTSYSRASERVADVRFRIDQASDRDLNRLVQCLQRQPGVMGFQQPEAGG